MISRKETKELLSSMADKGYTKIGVIFTGHRTLDILLIHKDWKSYAFQKHFRQAYDDIPAKIHENYMFSLEVPTREMYDKDRTEDAPKHKILVDFGPYLQRSYWKRKGLFYYATLQFFRGQQSIGVLTKKLDFVSYHLIKVFHGTKGLNEMALKFDINRLG